MSGFLYQIVKDALDYDNKEEMAKLYALRLVDIREWCEEQFDLAGVPQVVLQYILQDLWDRDDDFHCKLWQYIQDTCEPEESDSEPESEAE